MTRVSRWALGAVLTLLAGCGGDDSGATNPSTSAGVPKLSGVVSIDGSSTVFRISNIASQRFNEVQPDVTVTVNKSGTGGGFGKYAEGEIDIVDASRPAKDAEEANAKTKGYDWTRFLIAYDGISVVVNPSNTWVKSLTVEQLKKLWEPNSTVKTWKDLDPTWPDKPVKLYSPDDDSGTFDFFTEEIVGKTKAQREDVQASSDDNVLVKGAAGDPEAIGYFGYAYYAANSDKLKVVPIQDGPNAKPVAPDPETILNKSYSPLSRPLFLYVKNASMRKPEVRGFVSYYLENSQVLAKAAKYVPCTAEDHAANLAALKGEPAKAAPASGKPAE